MKYTFAYNVSKDNRTNADPCAVLHCLFATLSFAMPVFYEHTIDNTVYKARN